MLPVAQGNEAALFFTSMKYQACCTPCSNSVLAYIKINHKGKSLRLREIGSQNN